MRLYLDSSVVVAVLFQESGRAHYESALASCEAAFSSYLIEAEACAALTRERMPLRNVEEALEKIHLLAPTRSLRPEYAEIFSSAYCRGADAHHLATALFLDPSRQELVFASADLKQKKIAAKLGFKTV
jgi:predicted nucleic acid-binding protein